MGIARVIAAGFVVESREIDLPNQAQDEVRILAFIPHRALAELRTRLSQSCKASGHGNSETVIAPLR